MPSDDHVLAHELATAAGRALLDLRAGFFGAPSTGPPDGLAEGRLHPNLLAQGDLHSPDTRERGLAEGRLHPNLLAQGDLQRDGWPRDPKELRDAGDRTAHEFLMESLAAERPRDAVLSEESFGTDGLDPPRMRADRVWIVDPLDGTREFAEAGRDDWAVHVALWARAEDAPDGDLVAGAVALPAQGVTLSTLDPPRCPPHGRAAARIVVSRTRPPEFVERLAQRLDATLVPMGSAGAKIAAVVQGEVDAYVHAGGQYEWDSAAPVAVARAAGAYAARIDGSVLEYNREDPTLPDIVVCRSSLAPTLLAGIRSAANGVTSEGNHARRATDTDTR